VIRFFISFIFFTAISYAQSASVVTGNINDINISNTKIIYWSYDSIPKRIINGQIYPVSIKYIITNPKFTSLRYTLNQTHATLTPIRSQSGIYHIDTLYLYDSNNSQYTPPITATAVNRETNSSYPTTAQLQPQRLNVITLNPPKNFSGVIADNFKVTNYKTTTYDNQSNILLFFAKALHSNLKVIHFKNITKQGLESLDENRSGESTAIYYLIINKNLENFNFTYFNLNNQNYQKISIPIKVISDTVSTQTNISPVTDQHTVIKLAAAAAVLFILIIVVIFRRKLFYILLALIVGAYIMYLLLPPDTVCIKSGSKIQILPIGQGIVFKQTKTNRKFKVLDKRNKYTRIELNKNKVGWVKNEDICKN